MIVVDNFIKDKKYLKKLNDEKHLLFKIDRGNHTYAQRVQWWEGWWKEKAKNVHEELIEHIVKNNPLIDDEIISKTNYFEHWTNELTVDDDLKWHQNKDEELYLNEFADRHPLLSLVFWPYEQKVQGGYLEIISDKMEGNPYDFLYQSERITPKGNRLVIMDPSNWHRVTKVKDGVRRTFVVDLWDKK